MQILKSKFFWINLLGLLVNVGQYFLTNNLAPDYTMLITTIIGVLQVIANSVAGIAVASQNTQLKAKLAKLSK